MPDPQPLDLAIPPGMQRSSFLAMGTTISLLLPEAQAQAGTDLVRRLFASWEATLSRFRPESELSSLNTRAGDAVPVGPLLFGVIERALEAARATGGLYDPSLQQHLLRLGYDRSFEDVPERAPIIARLPGPGGGWRGIRMDPAHRTVTLPAGVGLDFGGIAKGMAVDAALEQLRAADVGAALVNAGGDLAVIGLPPHGTSWPVAVQGPGGWWTIPLQRGAMATSGIARRRWQQGQVARHHLLDPRTGVPAAGGVWSTTVVAARCEQAEVAAKAAFLLGAEGGIRFLEDRRLAGLLVWEDGHWRAAGPWPRAAMQVER